MQKQKSWYGWLHIIYCTCLLAWVLVNCKIWVLCSIMLLLTFTWYMNANSIREWKTCIFFWGHFYWQGSPLITKVFLSTSANIINWPSLNRSLVQFQSFVLELESLVLVQKLPNSWLSSDKKAVPVEIRADHSTSMPHAFSVDRM